MTLLVIPRIGLGLKFYKGQNLTPHENARHELLGIMVEVIIMLKVAGVKSLLAQ